MKILIVENEKSLARMLQLLLQKAGHEVLGPVSTVREALEIITVALPELALIDIYLDGDVQGTELAKVLAARGDTTIIFTTADTEKAQSFSHYSFGLLQKPYPLSSIMPTIRLVESLRKGLRYQTMPPALRLFRFPEQAHINAITQQDCGDGWNSRA